MEYNIAKLVVNSPLIGYTIGIDESESHNMNMVFAFAVINPYCGRYP